MNKATVIVIGSAEPLASAVKRVKEKKYSVIGVHEWPQGDYLMIPMYCIDPVSTSFQSQHK
jgi:hypothetical protein